MTALSLSKLQRRHADDSVSKLRDLPRELDRIGALDPACWDMKLARIDLDDRHPSSLYDTLWLCKARAILLQATRFPFSIPTAASSIFTVRRTVYAFFPCLSKYVRLIISPISPMPMN